MSRRHNTPARHGAARAYAPAPELAASEVPAGPPMDAHGLPVAPAGWHKGQLLNVRNAGSHYNVTLLGEEYDPRSPERCLQFTNPADAQNFVSRWYAPDPGPRPP